MDLQGDKIKWYNFRWWIFTFATWYVAKKMTPRWKESQEKWLLTWMWVDVMIRVAIIVIILTLIP